MLRDFAIAPSDAAYFGHSLMTAKPEGSRHNTGAFPVGLSRIATIIMSGASGGILPDSIRGMRSDWGWKFMAGSETGNCVPLERRQQRYVAQASGLSTIVLGGVLC